MPQKKGDVDTLRHAKVVRTRGGTIEERMLEKKKNQEVPWVYKIYPPAARTMVKIKRERDKKNFYSKSTLVVAYNVWKRAPESTLASLRTWGGGLLARIIAGDKQRRGWGVGKICGRIRDDPDLL